MTPKISGQTLVRPKICGATFKLPKSFCNFQETQFFEIFVLSNIKHLMRPSCNFRAKKHWNLWNRREGLVMGDQRANKQPKKLQVRVWIDLNNTDPMVKLVFKRVLLLLLKLCFAKTFNIMIHSKTTREQIFPWQASQNIPGFFYTKMGESRCATQMVWSEGSRVTQLNLGRIWLFQTISDIIVLVTQDSQVH